MLVHLELQKTNEHGQKHMAAFMKLENKIGPEKLRAAVSCEKPAVAVVSHQAISPSKWSSAQLVGELLVLIISGGRTRKL